MQCNSSAYVVKLPSETRWSARHDAVRALKVNYSSIVKAMGVKMNDTEQPRETRADARSIMYKLYALGNIIISYAWCDILECINKGNQLLQTAGLIDYFNIIRNEFDSYETEAIETLTILPTREDDPKPNTFTSKITNLPQTKHAWSRFCRTFTCCRYGIYSRTTVLIISFFSSVIFSQVLFLYWGIYQS